MSATLSVIIGIVIVAMIVAVVCLIVGGIHWILDNHATTIWFFLKPPVFIFILSLVWQSRIPLNNFFSRHGFITFLTNILVLAVIFVIFPRKSLVKEHKTSSHEKHHKITYHIDLDTGKFGSSGGGTSYLTYDDYTLWGSSYEKSFNSKYDNFFLWDGYFNPKSEKGIFTGTKKYYNADILSHNLIFKYGEKNIPCLKLTELFIWIYPIISIFWLCYLSALGQSAPHLMEMMIYPMLWFIFFEKKLYYSMAHAKIFNAKKWFYWLSVVFDLLICLYNAMSIGKTNDSYKEVALIYTIFIITSSIVFYIKHKNQHP